MAESATAAAVDLEVVDAVPGRPGAQPVEKKRSKKGFRSLFGCAGGSKRSTSPVGSRPVKQPLEAKPAGPSLGAAVAAGSNGGAATAAPAPAPAGATAASDSAQDGADSKSQRTRQEYDPKYVYDMRHPKRGLALVFNFQDFNPEMNLSFRHGSDKDTLKLEAALKQLKFSVYTYNNLTAVEFLRELKQVAEADHTENDAISIVIMSHGEEGVIFARDNAIMLTEVFEPFRQCNSLVGKPKLFFIQACRGNKFDSGKERHDGEEDTEAEAFKRAVDCTDGIKNIQRLPTDADFLICYSVVPGYFSWRNGAYGSWFVQKLTEVLSQTDCEKVDFMRVMTRVNRAVAYEFESHTNNPLMDRKKQVPSIVSMLTKELYFPTS